jgi:hypothetical protein
MNSYTTVYEGDSPLSIRSTYSYSVLRETGPDLTEKILAVSKTPDKKDALGRKHSLSMIYPA